MLNKTKALCAKYNIKPARSKGQNFLINSDVYKTIIKVADVSRNDNVLEIGPGLGFLTMELIKRAKQVVAVELDDKLAMALQQRLKEEGSKNIILLNADILDFPNLSFPKGFLNNYQIVANLPYNITSVFLRKFLSSEYHPESMTILVQKEVAERIIALPGKMSLLAVAVQFYAQVKSTIIVPAHDFWPVPKVNSAILRIEFDPRYVRKIKKNEIDDFFRLVKFGFSAKRKMLKNNLAGGLKIESEKILEILEQNNFDSKIRAQNLSVLDWIKLFGALRSFMV